MTVWHFNSSVSVCVNCEVCLVNYKYVNGKDAYKICRSQIITDRDAVMTHGGNATVTFFSTTR